MKANEAPKKIYIVIDPIWGSMSVNYNRNDTDNIEYTRTDAFIAKVEEFLYEKLNSGDMECGDIVTFINDFKKAMRV